MKVGLIGRGSISYAHMAAYDRMKAEQKDVEIVACCDIRPEQMDDMGDVRKYTNIDTFLEAEKGNLDYVDICLPTYLHTEVSIKAMKKGYNVLCEKPMTLTFEDAKQMCDVAKETQRLLMIAQCSRFLGAFREMYKVCQSGELGKVRHAEFYREGGSLEPMGYQNWFRNESLSGGAILDLHVHDADLIRAAFGMPKAVSTIAANHIPGAGYDALTTHYIYDDMFVCANCDWTTAHNKINSRSFRMNFEKGYMFVDRSPERTIFLKMDINGNAEDLTDKIDAGMYYNEITYYMDCLNSGKPVSLCPPEETAESVKIALAEKKSADLQGEKVYL